MEDYKQKYEKALERAKSHYKNGKSLEYASDLASDIFPELCESEDERIRKECISIIDAWDKACRLQGDYCEVAPECIAWLEKQGKQKPTNKVKPKFKVGDVIKNIDNGDTVKIEQILDNYYCYSGWDGVATIHSDFTISEQDNWELVEQNPDWSEDDEKQARQIERIVHNAGCSQKLQEQIAGWLKSLKERIKGE